MRYPLNRMIKSFRCKHAEALFRGRPTIRFHSFQSVAERKLQMLDIARRIDDMRIPPANRLEVLRETGAGSGAFG